MTLRLPWRLLVVTSGEGHDAEVTMEANYCYERVRVCICDGVRGMGPKQKDRRDPMSSPRLGTVTMELLPHMSPGGGGGKRVRFIWNDGA